MHQTLRHQTIVDKYTYKEELHFDTSVDLQPSEMNQFTVLHDLALLELTSTETKSTENHERMDPFSTLHFSEAYGYGYLHHFTSNSTTYHQIR